MTLPKNLIAFLVAGGSLFFPIGASAMVFYQTSFESVACNHQIRNESVDGAFWDSFYDPTSIVKCSPLTAPGGTKYLEWPNVTSQSQTWPQVNLGSTHTIVSGATYYLAARWRFQRSGGLPIWSDNSASQDGQPWKFDKLLETNYGSGDGWRWMMQAGYAPPLAGSNKYRSDKFLFSVYGSDAIYNGWTYYGFNQNGYSPSNPFYCDYERWYSVVIGITAHTSNGTVEYWINGTKVGSHTGIQTMVAGATMSQIGMNGTIAQPDYDAPTHSRQVDTILLTNNWTDVVNGGFLSDPQGTPDTTAPTAPTGLGVQ